MKEFNGSGFFVIVLSLLLIASSLVLMQFKIPVPEGVWKDVSENYYVVFYDDGTYSESTYNLSRPYSLEDDRLVLRDIAGQQCVAQLTRSFGGKMTVNLNGHTRVLSPSKDKPVLYQWDGQVTSQPLEAYKLAGGLEKTYYLRLFPDNLFVSILGSTETVGKYATTTAGELLLFTRAGNSIECFVPCSRGYAFGSMDTDISRETLKANAVTDRGLLLSGVASYADAGVGYTFTEDNFVTRRDASGLTVEFIYFADPNGIITMTDTAGMGVEDQLYYDVSTGTAYRYLLERDGWIDYLVSAGQQGVTE